jgi:hypothetical protein
LSFDISHLSLKQDRRPETDDRKQEHLCLLAVVGLLSSVALEMTNEKCQMTNGKFSPLGKFCGRQRTAAGTGRGPSPNVSGSGKIEFVL